MKSCVRRSYLGFIFIFQVSEALATPRPKPQHMITEEQAKAVALKIYSGAVASSELEFENDRWVYSFDIRDRDKQGSIHEILVDAVSGKMLSQKIETAAEEAAEKAQD